MVIIKFRPRETKTTKSGRPIHETNTSNLLVWIGPFIYSICLCARASVRASVLTFSGFGGLRTKFRISFIVRNILWEVKQWTDDGLGT